MTRSWRARPALAFGLSVALAVLAIPRAATAARIALLVGNDEGHAGDPRLRYAETDASRFAALLTRIGGFAPDATVVTLGRSAAELQRALAAVAARLRATPGENLVVVYYSGHADAQGLHLGSSTFSLTDLRAQILALPAATRVLILDACQAGILTRAKGGRPGLGFEVPLDGGAPVRGLAILAASADSELAQESDQLGGSVFTHHLEVGLAGLADRNGDGNVSLGEAFDYASERTVATTFGTTTGPQHPTFRLDLEGRDDLVLTRPGQRGVGYGQIRLNIPGWYFIRREGGTLVAEVRSRGGETLALEPGPYEVTRRGTGGLDVSAVTIAEGEATAIDSVPSRPVAFGRMVRKGGAGGPQVAYGLAVVTTVRTPLEDLGPAFGLGVAARADLSAVSLEARLRLGRSQEDGTRLATTTWESAVSLAALRAHDFGARGFGSTRGWRLPTVAAGAEAGVAYLAQALDDGQRHASLSPFIGPAALAELAVGHRLFVRADLALPVYALRVTQASGTTETHWRPALVAAVGAGAWF
jgi:hypothetical protein